MPGVWDTRVSLQRGRGHSVTIGRVGDLPVAEARSAAEALQSAVSRGTLERLSRDAKLNQRSARAQARQALRATRGARRRTWKGFIDGYKSWPLGT